MLENLSVEEREKQGLQVRSTDRIADGLRDRGIVRDDAALIDPPKDNRLIRQGLLARQGGGQKSQDPDDDRAIYADLVSKWDRGAGDPSGVLAHGRQIADSLGWTPEQLADTKLGQAINEANQSND